MRQVYLWKAAVGRFSTETILVGATHIDQAIDLAVEWIRENKSDWKGVSRADVKSIESTDQSVIVSKSGP